MEDPALSLPSPQAPPSPFDLLEPPSTAGFLKLSRPCCYVFPGGTGDSAFFAVDGFTVLVDGGGDASPCFWKLVRRLDRVDALLLTHAGPGSLTGVASLLRRKVAELEERATPEGDAPNQRLVSPEIGVVFLNAPKTGDDPTAPVLRCLERLAIVPEPLSRTPGPHAQPITLFRKMGVGQLDMYVLSPGRGGRESSCLTSICALLVWRPSQPHEQLVRVLFPGHASQASILEGLERLRHLDFLRRPPDSPEHPGAELEPAQKAGDRSKRDPPRGGRVAATEDAGPKGGGEGGGKGKRGGGGRDAPAKTDRPANGEGTEKRTAAKKEPPAAKLRRDLKSEEKKGGRAEEKRAGQAGEKRQIRALGKEVGKAAPGPALGKKEGPRRETENRGTKWRRDQRSTKASGAPDGTAQRPEGASKESRTKRDTGSIAARSKEQEEQQQQQREQQEQEDQGPAGMSDAAEGQKSTQAGEGGEDGDWRSPEKIPETLPTPNAPIGSPCLLRTCRGEGNATFDLTPTEYRLLDGAFKEGSLRAALEFGSPPNGVGRPLSGPKAVSQSPGLPKANGTAPSAHQEKHSSFLLLSPLRDLFPETCSLTTLTPSLPAELGSPQSTEMEESLSVSLEQGLPPPCPSPGGHAPEPRPPARAPQTPYAADLCLVSPCEYDHLNLSPSQNAPLHPRPHSHGDPASQEPANPRAEPRDLDTPPGTGDCGLDSDEDFLPRRTCDPCSALGVSGGGRFPGDPPPTPVKDLPPLPPVPGACMVDPETRPRSAHSGAARARKPAGVAAAQRPSSTPSGRTALRARPVGDTPTTPATPHIPPVSHRPPTTRPSTAGSAGGKAGVVGGAWVCVDLAYLPSGPASSTVDAEFFRRVRSSYYVVSGAEPGKEAELRSVLNALLEGKARWPGKAQVTVIPTYESPAVQEWCRDTREQQEALDILVLGSNSTVAMQDEIFPACKVEF